MLVSNTQAFSTRPPKCPKSSNLSVLLQNNQQQQQQKKGGKKRERETSKRTDNAPTDAHFKARTAPRSSCATIDDGCLYALRSVTSNTGWLVLGF